MNSLSLNPWTQIWFRPRATFQALLSEAPTYSVLTLASLSGFANAIAQASKMEAGSHLSLWLILPLCLVLGGMVGVLGLYIGAWVVAYSGRWIGGQADAARLRTVLSWANLPTVAGLATWLVMLLLMGEDVFLPKSQETLQTADYPMLLILTALIQMVLAIWSLVLMVIGVSQAQEFNAVKAILNLLIPVIGLMAISGLISVLLTGMAG